MANIKSKKAPGKLSKVLRAFNPRSFRGGMALFALVFAFTGGGYMLYRSFAATTIVILGASQMRGYGNAYTVTETEEKKGLTVWALPAQGGVIGDFTVQQSRYYNLCVMAKHTNANAGGPDALKVAEVGQKGDLIVKNVYPGGSYSKNCVRAYLQANGKYGLDFENSGNTSPVRISLMTLEY